MTKTLRLGENRKVDGLEVHVAGRKKTYVIPGMNDLSMGDLMVFRRVSKMPEEERDDAYADAFYALCCKYVDKDVIDSLTLDDFKALMDAYGEVSDETGEVGPGES